MFGLSTKIIGIVAGSIFAGMAILLAISGANARHWHKMYVAAESGRQLEMAKNAINLGSLHECLASIDDMNAAVTKLKADGDARQAMAVKAAEAARRDAEGAEAQARALEASAKGSGSGAACRASSAFMSAKDGL